MAGMNSNRIIVQPFNHDQRGFSKRKRNKRRKHDRKTLTWLKPMTGGRFVSRLEQEQAAHALKVSGGLDVRPGTCHSSDEVAANAGKIASRAETASEQVTHAGEHPNNTTMDASGDARSVQALPVGDLAGTVTGGDNIPSVEATTVRIVAALRGLPADRDPLVIGEQVQNRCMP